MIIYDLSCEDGHRFEGWFKTPEDCLQQSENGLLSCPVCGSHNINKLPTASHIASSTTTRKEGAENNTVHLGQSADTRLAQAVRALQEHVRENFVDVGDQFPEEARKIHYGESDKENIRGTAAPDEVQALAEEGIDIFPLPLPNIDPTKLN